MIRAFFGSNRGGCAQRIVRDLAAQAEREPVLGRPAAHGFLDAVLEALQRQRQFPALEGDAEHDNVDVELRAEDALGKLRDIGAEVTARVGVLAQRLLERLDAEIVGAEQRIDRRRLLPVDDHAGARAAHAQVAFRIEPACRLEDVDADHEIGLAVGDDGRGVVAAGLEERDVRVDAAVANGEAVLVAEDDLVTFPVAGPDQRGRRDADAHAADPGEVAMPGMGECARGGQGKKFLLQVGQV